MKLYLLRHGRTKWNQEQRYQGQTDLPLSDEGRAELVEADFCPDTLWVSPMLRARETARAIFPRSRQILVPDLIEMNFGTFEGRNYRDMEHDPDYRAWVADGCTGRCPGGEDFEGFARRIKAAFLPLLENALEEGREELVILSHGGVQLALMEAYALPERDHFSWVGPCAGGYVLTTELWESRRKLQLVDTVQYTAGD